MVLSGQIGDEVERIMLKMSAFQFFHGGNLTFINTFDKTKIFIFQYPSDAALQFLVIFKHQMSISPHMSSSYSDALCSFSFFQFSFFSKLLSFVFPGIFFFYLFRAKNVINLNCTHPYVLNS